MSHAHDANQLKFASRVTQKQLANSCHKRAVLILISKSIPSVNTPRRDCLLSNQIVEPVLGIYESVTFTINFRVGERIILKDPKQVAQLLFFKI